MSWGKVFSSIGISTIIYLLIVFVDITINKFKGREIDYNNLYKTFFLLLTITTIGLILAHFGIYGGGRYYYDVWEY